MSCLLGCIERGTSLVSEQLKATRGYVHDVEVVWGLLQPQAGCCEERRSWFDELGASFAFQSDPIHRHMGRLMASFSPGLFAGGDDCELPSDNLELERAFRLPKGHERRIHGHAHAGVRIVQQGATLLPALDAHVRHPDPFTSDELAPYVKAPLPAAQLESEHRRRVMRRARSSKRRQELLASLEARYQHAFRDS